jgi:hypothetical protein
VKNQIRLLGAVSILAPVFADAADLPPALPAAQARLQPTFRRRLQSTIGPVSTSA